MIVREHLSCIFASAPIADCGRDMRVPETVLASSWPLAGLFFCIAGLCGYAFLRALYPKPIDWEHDLRPERPLRRPEDAARDAGA